MIPAAALARGERAFVAVLRRRYPDATFLVRDGAVGPLDDDMLGQVRGCTARDDNPAKEASENLPALGGLEALPKLDERATNGKLRKAGR